jgi:hypothetical protein
MMRDEPDVGHDQRQHGDPAESRFRASLQVLDQRIDWVPMGWQRLYGDLRSKLRAIECSSRRVVFIHGAHEQDGYLHVEAITDDQVVQGILRKARATALYTCMGCGRRGKPRAIGEQRLSLCVRCAGCVQLRDVVESVLVTPEPRCVHLHHAIARSNLLGAAVHASLGSEVEPAALSEVSSQSLKAWLDGMLESLDAIADCVHQ